MDPNTFPTKGNLILAKNSLALSRQGFELMDKKRNILIREMMTLIDTAKVVRDEIEDTYKKAYAALQRANVTLGVCQDLALSTPVETGVEITYRSVMGVEIPHITLKPQTGSPFRYSLHNSNSQLDQASVCFQKCKELTVTLAEVENSIYRLAVSIKKTQRRANALKNIVIPNFQGNVAYITNALDEKEREEFSRLKVIRHTKDKKQAE